MIVAAKALIIIFAYNSVEIWTHVPEECFARSERRGNRS